MTPDFEPHVAVAEVMQTPVRSVESGATLRDVAQALRHLRTGTVVVMAGDDVVAIVSERDIVRAIADGADPETATVEQVMSGLPRYVTPSEDVRTALETMLAARIRHLPVMDEGELVGIVSMRDLAAAFVH